MTFLSIIFLGIAIICILVTVYEWWSSRQEQVEKEECRCYVCGDTPMKCGSLCADCSHESYLSYIAHTGEDWETPSDETPECCKRSHEVERSKYADSSHD